MNEFIADLIAFMQTIMPNVYESLADIDKALPYAVITFPNGLNSVTDSSVGRRKFLEVDLYSKDSGEPALNDFADALDQDQLAPELGLHEKKFVGTGYYCKLIHEFRGKIPEPDNTLRRIQLRYLIKYKNR